MGDGLMIKIDPLEQVLRITTGGDGANIEVGFVERTENGVFCRALVLTDGRGGPRVEIGLGRETMRKIHDAIQSHLMAKQ